MMKDRREPKFTKPGGDGTILVNALNRVVDRHLKRIKHNPSIVTKTVDRAIAQVAKDRKAGVIPPWIRKTV